MIPCYLLPQEAALLLGVSRRHVDRLLADERLPHLYINQFLRRVEASALIVGAPEVLPPGPDVVTKSWLANLLRLREFSVQAMASASAIPMWKLTDSPSSPYCIRRGELYRWTIDHSRGDDVVPGARPIDPDALAQLELAWARPVEAATALEVARG